MDVLIQAPVAEAFQRAPAENIMHHCPLCDQTMEWEPFQAHAPACIEAHSDHPAVIAARQQEAN